jgi:peptidoglycan/xylan/chitin deacetylase (PgdA/CDA1 family)
VQHLKEHGIPVVSFTALVEALEGKGSVSPGAVVITFDDGRVNQYHNAFPLLKKLGFPATFFPFTHAMDKNPRYFTWAQLQEMQSAGMSVGSHTSLHVRVDKMKDAKQIHTGSRGREQLQAKLGATATEYTRTVRRPCGCRHSAVRAAGTAPPAPTPAGAGTASAIAGAQGRPMTENMKRFARVIESSAAAGAPATASRHQARATAGAREAAAGTLGTQNPPPERPAGGRMR